MSVPQRLTEHLTKVEQVAALQYLYGSLDMHLVDRC